MSKANESDEVFELIFEKTKHVNRMIKQVSSASIEQASAIEEITTAVHQLDETAHQNANMANESSVMADSLQVQAKSLRSSLTELLVISGRKEKRESIAAPSPENPKARHLQPPDHLKAA